MEILISNDIRTQDTTQKIYRYPMIPCTTQTLITGYNSDIEIYRYAMIHSTNTLITRIQLRRYK